MSTSVRQKAIGNGVYAQQAVTSGTVHGVVFGVESDWIGAQIGHNYVSVADSYQFTRSLPPDQAEQYVEPTIATVFATVRAALANAPQR